MGLSGIFDPLVRAYFEENGGGGEYDEAIAAMAAARPYGLKSLAATSVGESAFYQEPELESVYFPNVTTIGYSAFYECYALKSASFEKAVEIGDGAFAYCSKLENVILPSLIHIGTDSFNSTSALRTINLPNVVAVSLRAFQYSGLTKADLGKVGDIGALAFSACHDLTAVIIRTTSIVCTADLTAFDETPLLTGQGHIYVPASMYEYYRAGYEPNLQAGFFDILFRKIEDYPEICG